MTKKNVQKQSEHYFISFKDLENFTLFTLKIKSAMARSHSEWTFSDFTCLGRFYENAPYCSNDQISQVVKPPRTRKVILSSVRSRTYLGWNGFRFASRDCIFTGNVRTEEKMVKRKDVFGRAGRKNGLLYELGTLRLLEVKPDEIICNFNRRLLIIQERSARWQGDSISFKPFRSSWRFFFPICTNTFFYSKRTILIRLGENFAFSLKPFQNRY